MTYGMIANSKHTQDIKNACKENIWLESNIVIPKDLNIFIFFLFISTENLINPTKENKDIPKRIIAATKLNCP